MPGLILKVGRGWALPGGEGWGVRNEARNRSDGAELACLRLEAGVGFTGLLGGSLHSLLAPLALADSKLPNTTLCLGSLSRRVFLQLKMA